MDELDIIVELGKEIKKLSKDVKISIRYNNDKPHALLIQSKTGTDFVYSSYCKNIDELCEYFVKMNVFNDVVINNEKRRINNVK